MSHVAAVELTIKDLPALKAACAALGLEFMEGQQTYKWFGRSVGDYPLPAGFTADDLGKCEHAIRIPDGHPAKRSNSYEIGVVRRRDGQPGYCLMWDFWQGGYGLRDVVGKDCVEIKKAYARQATIAQAQRSGFRIQERKLANGSVQLVLQK